MEKMEKNTVLLDVNTYNELRDFREKVKEEGKIYVSTGYSSAAFYTKDEALKLAGKLNDELKDTNKKLQGIIEGYKHPQKEEETVEDILKLSVWQFMKRRRNKK